VSGSSSDASQPFPSLPSQSSKPARQENPQTPPEQVALAFAAPGQTLPHAPQFVTSLLVSMQPPSGQIVRGGGHMETQASSAQYGDGASQVTRHAPQLADVRSGVSHPFERSSSQSPKLGSHLDTQFPASQT